MTDVTRDYLLLGLRFDRLVEGFVDAYFGDPALKQQVADEPTPDPRDLAVDAARLLRALPDSGLAADRRRFLEGQLTGLETSGRKLAGDEVGFVDEVEAYFQVRPTMGDPSAYDAAHHELGALLPGTGSLPERYQAYRRADEIDPSRLEEAVRALSSALRDVTRSAYRLPEAEVVEYEVVTNQPWSGFNYYLGDYRSRVAINADLPMRLVDIPHLVAHESYPGHHTEHCRKERLLVDAAKQAEQSIFLVNTPECLMAEGLADLGLRASIGAGWGSWAQEVYADLGLRFDGERAERIAMVTSALNTVRQDAALMLHDQGRSEDEVVDYLRSWALLPEERARKSLGFLTSPLWRAYTSTYVEGHALLSAWLDAGVPASASHQVERAETQARFARLLDEPLTPGAIALELAA